VVEGAVKEIGAGSRTVVISHEAIPGYMAAMTMPFKVQRPEELKGLQAGDRISFRLQVTETQSWIDRIARTGTARSPSAEPRGVVAPETRADVAARRHPLLDYKFTNELSQAVSLGDFRGQAVAITFFFTRCPLPEFCPRLSRNFEEASEALLSRPGTPTNWHFLSISFDPTVDTPAVLKAYGERYHYLPARWSFLTGPPEQINELARLSGVEVESAGGFFNHNFRTLIVDAAGHVQTTFPFGGDLSDAIVGEMLKAMAATNPLPSASRSTGELPAIAGGVAQTAAQNQ
jgi:protein SCO1/2